MKINQRQQEEVHVFDLAGELDFHSSPQLRDSLGEVLGNPNHKVVINLKEISYIDSSGLATFVEALQKAKRSNGKLILFELAPSVKSVFEIAKLDKVFSLAGTEDEAMQLANA